MNATPWVKLSPALGIAHASQEANADAQGPGTEAVPLSPVLLVLEEPGLLGGTSQWYSFKGRPE